MNTQLGAITHLTIAYPAHHMANGTRDNLFTWCLSYVKDTHSKSKSSLDPAPTMLAMGVIASP